MEPSKWYIIYLLTHPMNLFTFMEEFIGLCLYMSKSLCILQMTAEFQVPSPIVPTRENYFVRYCKQHADGMWAVVDVSLDSLQPGAVPRCRRRPSGCLIQELPNGYSKVHNKVLCYLFDMINYYDSMIINRFIS